MPGVSMRKGVQIGYGQRILSPKDIAGLAAWYDVSDGASLLKSNGSQVTTVGDTVALITDKSGNSGTNCWCNSDSTVASQSMSAANKTVVGNQIITLDIAMDTYRPSVDRTVVNKLSSNDGFQVLILTTGIVRLRVGNGSSVTNVDSTVALANNNYTRTTVAITWTDGVGASFTQDGSALGTSVSAAITLTNAAATITLGQFLGRIYRIQIGSVYDCNPALASKLVTSFSSGGDTWTVNTANATGSRISGERDLVNFTTASQPVYLPWSGTNYGWLTGTSGSYFSTPDSATVDLTGTVEVITRVRLNDWTPSVQQNIISKWLATGDQRSYRVYVFTDGTLFFEFTTLGTVASRIQVVSTAATGITDGTTAWIRVVRNGTTGNVDFYRATDQSAVPTFWTQIGTTVASSNAAIFGGTSPIEAGSASGGAEALAGSIFRVQLYGGSTLVADFNPVLYTSGTTFTAPTGEVWTLNGGAAIVTKTCLYFDGSNDYAKAAGFSLSQPESVYFTGQEISWTSGDYILDGNAANSGAIIQTTSTPQININAGSSVAANTGLGTAIFGVITSIFNAASSILRINRINPTSGNAGASNMSGLIVGSSATPGNYGNIAMNELLVYSAAHDLPVQNLLITYEGAKWRINVNP